MPGLYPGGLPGQACTCALCGHEFSQDPCYEVDCPTCGAKKGTRCKRPSGHTGPAIAFHAARDLLASKLGFYDHECDGAEVNNRPLELPSPATKAQPALF